MVVWIAGLSLAVVVLVVGMVREMVRGHTETEGPDAPYVSAAAGSSAGSPLRVAVAPVVSPRSSLPRYAALVDNLAAITGRRGRLILRDSYAEVDALLRTGQCDAAFVCTWVYAQGAAEYGLELLVAPVVRGKTTYRSLLIVPRDSAALGLLDLRGKRMAAADALSNTGWLYLVDRLRLAGEDPDRFFSEVVFTGGHDLAILAVRDGHADGAAVDSLVYEEMVHAERVASTPSIVDRLKVIHESEFFGMPPVVTPPSLPPDLKGQLLQAFLHLHESPEGQQAMAILGSDRFDVARPDAYESVRAMHARHREASAR